MCAMNASKTDPRQKFYQGLSPQGFHTLAYVEWGDQDNPDVLICVHALTRNSRDFDYLARDLQKKYRIICPDLLGRGKSEYVRQPSVYNFKQYMNDLVALLAHAHVQKVHWLGTSLGGILGMMLASQPHSPLKSLILNDIGMIVPSAALQRIETYAHTEHEFSNLEDAKRYFQTVLAPIGPLDSKKWDHLTKHGTLAHQDGTLSLAYDPAIGENFATRPTPTLHFETYWQAIHCPILLLYGEDSDFLSQDIITKMLYLQPATQIEAIPECGHAPSLMEPDQIHLVEEWLERESSLLSS